MSALQLDFTRNSDTVWLDFEYTPGGVAFAWTTESAVVEIRTKPLTGVAANDAASVLLSRMTTAAGTIALGVGSVVINNVTTASGSFRASVVNDASAANTSVIDAGTYFFDARMTDTLSRREEPLLSGTVVVKAQVGTG